MPCFGRSRRTYNSAINVFTVYRPEKLSTLNFENHGDRSGGKAKKERRSLSNMTTVVLDASGNQWSSMLEYRRVVVDNDTVCLVNACKKKAVSG